MWVTLSGPAPVWHAALALGVWCLVALGVGALVHALYIGQADTPDEHLRRVSNVQVWCGYSGFIGTALVGVLVLGLLYAGAYAAFYSRLISRDATTLAVYGQAFGDKILAISKKYSVVDELLKTT